MPDAILRLRALALVALLVPLAAFGQAWPTKPVRLISPFAAGGGASASPVSTQCLMRCASPSRVNLPFESSSTITSGRLAMLASITRQRPASRM